MTTGTVLAFIFTGITAPVAIVSGIWLEARMPAPQPAGPPRHVRQPHPAGLLPGGHQADLRHLPRTGSSPRRAPPVTPLGLRGPHQLGPGFPVRAALGRIQRIRISPARLRQDSNVTSNIRRYWP